MNLRFTAFEKCLCVFQSIDILTLVPKIRLDWQAMLTSFMLLLQVCQSLQSRSLALKQKQNPPGILIKNAFRIGT